MRERCLVPLLIAGAGALAGCGSDEPGLSPPAPSSRVYVLPSNAYDQADAHSYIVAFRAPQGSAARSYTSYLHEAKTQQFWLDQRFEPDPRVRSVRFITSIDLAKPDADVDKGFQVGPMHLAWDEQQLEEMAAALAEVNFHAAEAAGAVLHEWDAAGELWFAEPNWANRLDGVRDDRLGPMPAARASAASAPPTAQPFLQNAELAKTLEVEAYKSAEDAIWWHKRINLAAGLEYATTMKISEVGSPLIAVLDSGVDVQNPALADRIWVNPSPGSSGCGADTYGCDTTLTQKGRLGDGSVWPFATSGFGESCPEAAKDVCPHGTHVAGIIAAKVDGTMGGACPVCRILPIRIIKDVNGKGQALDSAILNGLKYLTLFKNNISKQALVRVANASFGKSVRSRSVAVVVSVLTKKPNEVLVVGAAGNEDTMLRNYPAALSDALAVAAIAPDDGKATYSNFGPWVDIAAPGGDMNLNSNRTDGILSTVPGSTGKDFKQGTSMAAPVVAGIAGLILAVDPGRSFSSLRSSLTRTADPSIYDIGVRNGLNYNFYWVKPKGDSVRRPLLGSGTVDVLAALQNKENRGFGGDAIARVNTSCGRIAAGEAPSALNLELSWLLLLLPMLAAFHTRLR